ncbi:hypothetical protein MRX96_028210 [Rhipicephalus microplus]
MLLSVATLLEDIQNGVKQNTSTRFLIDQVIRNVNNNLLSVTTEDWTAANNVASPLVIMEHIYDYANGHVYSYVDTNGLVRCKIKARDDVALTVQFPDKNEVNFLQTILPIYDILKNASYLGILVTGPMPVENANLGHAVLTYGFLTVMTDRPALMMENSANIKRAFLEELQNVTRLSPLKTPDVLIDFMDNMAYVTVLILEHPAISGDYVEIPKMKIMEPESTEGAITRDNCLKACSFKDYKDCSAVSYCSSVCATTTKASVNSSGVLVNSGDCSTYVKTERSKRRNVVLTRDAISYLADALRKSEFKIVVKHLNTVIVVGTLVAETIEYSTGGLRNMIGESNPDLRHLHQRNSFNAPEGLKENLVVTALKTDKPYDGYVGSFELQDCADVCRDREDCFTFSSCLVGKQCVIATEARKPEFEETEFQADCTMYTKSYEMNSEELPDICYSSAATKYVGTSLASEWAASCMNDRSMLQVDNANDLDRSSAEKCSHFTRKHISDYCKERRVRLLGTPRTTIKKVSEAECARQCREATFRYERFDHCSGKNELGKSDCLLFDGDKGTDGTVMSPICNSYTYTGQYNDLVARAPQAFHSNAKAVGLFFFVVFLDVGIALAALFTYGIYKTRRASPQQ